LIVTDDRSRRRDAVLLDASLAFENVWPTPAIAWRGALSVECAVCVLAMAIALAQMGRWNSMNIIEQLRYDSIDNAVGGYHLAAEQRWAAGILLFEVYGQSARPDGRRIACRCCGQGAVFATVTFVLMKIIVRGVLRCQAIATRHPGQRAIEIPTRCAP
jgi:hypothetical protein